MDFSDPTNPVITDELEVPGFSSYLHKYADNLLLGIGRDEGSLKLSMFETDEDGKQTEVAKYLFREERKDEDVSPYASSTAEDNHRALMIDTENNIFGFDVNTYVYHVITNPDDELLNSVKDEAVAVYKEKYKTNETDDTYLQEYLKELEDPGNHYVYLDEDILTYDVFTYQDGEFVKLASIPLYEYYNVNGENTVSDDVLSQYENNYRNVRGIIIEDDVMLAGNVQLLSNNHDEYERQVLLCEKIVIKKGAWIGAGVSILPGVTVGKYAIVGAGAIVTKDVPDYSVAVGVPAKVVKTLDKDKFPE